MTSLDPTAEPESSPAARALAFAGAFTVCVLAGGALAITLLGNRHGAAITLDLSAPPQPRTVHMPRAPIAADPAETPVVGPVTKPVFAGKVLLADPALVENTPEGPLPRIAADGRTPMAAYAGAAPAAAGKIRIAIVVSGLGISASATKAALDGLPPGITLGFAPYASDVASWVSQARSSGHEVVLEVPMEPYDFPDSDPGPHTLRAGQDEESNATRLSWAMTRFTGYAGVTNLLGQRFLADSDALAPTLTFLNRRGLYFFDSGQASQSALPTVAGQIGEPATQGAPLDTIQSALEIDRQLSQLESQARANGGAVGSAFLYPVSIARIAAWAKGLSSRGFVLVPVSAIVSAPKQ